MKKFEKCKITKVVCKDDRPDDEYDSLELETGIEVEMEHTDNREIAKHIAKDHLDEFDNYYSNLVEMEHRLQQEKTGCTGSEGGCN